MLFRSIELAVGNSRISIYNRNDDLHVYVEKFCVVGSISAYEYKLYFHDVAGDVFPWRGYSAYAMGWRVFRDARRWDDSKINSKKYRYE